MRLPRLLTLCFFALSGALAAQVPASDPAELVKAGRALNNQGKQAEAIALYQQVLAKDPENYDARLAMGIALDLQGKYAEGREHLAKAIAVAPEKSRAQALRAMAMSHAFECHTAEVTDFEKQVFDPRLAAQDFTGAAEIANELARVLLECGQTGPARHWYETGYQTALKKADLLPPEKDLWGFRWEHAQARIAAREGHAAEAQKHVAAARAFLEKTANKEQERFYPYLVGYVAFYTGDMKTALAELAKADQQDPFILVLQAQANEKAGNAAAAADLYRRALQSNGHNPTNAFARELAKRKSPK